MPSAGASALKSAMHLDAASQKGCRWPYFAAMPLRASIHHTRKAVRGAALQDGRRAHVGPHQCDGGPEPSPAQHREGLQQVEGMPMPDAHAHAGPCSQGTDAAAHEAASASSTSDESDTCLDNSSLAGYCLCQNESIHKDFTARCCSFKTCSAWPSVQSLSSCPVSISCLSVCLSDQVAVHA